MNSQTIKEKLTGVFPPMMTPFKEDQSVDWDALAFDVEKYNETDIRGLMPLGSNGEFKSLTDEEAIQVVKVVKKHLDPKKTLMVGAGRESAYAALEFAKKAADEGADFVSLLTPFYFKGRMTDEALLKFFTYIADGSPIPVLVYCAPKFASGLVISPEVISALAAHPNVVGMKDTSAEDIKVYVEAAKGKDFNVLAGTISKYHYGLENGAVGGVLSAANYLPQPCAEIQQLFEAGKLEEAKALSDKLKALTSAASGKTGVAGSKACMNLLGFKAGVPRLPLLPATAEETEIARAALTEAGYLK